MKKILNINLVWWITWTNQLIKTISEWLWEWYKVYNLVWYCFWENNKTTSIYKTNKTKLYWNFRYKLAVWLNFLFDWLTPWHIDMKYLHNFKPYQEADIVHLHSIQWWFFDWHILPKISKEKKVVMTCHDDWIVSWNDENNLFFHYKTNFAYKTRKKILKNSDISYVWVSNRMSSKLKNDWIIWKNSVQTIYNWINTNIFNKKDKKICRNKLWLPLDKKIIISIAWAWKKSKMKWIKYVERLCDDLSYKDDLLFISIWNNEYKKVSDKFIEIWFLSPEEMSKYFSAADLFLYPTLADSFWLVVAESLACWCPIVTFETWWVPEIVQNNWYIAKYKDYEDLKKWFILILNKNLKVSLKDCFSQSCMINSYRKLYDSLLLKW